MRGLGLIGLVLALLVVGVLATKQLRGTQAVAVPSAAEVAASAGPGAPAPAPAPAPAEPAGSMRDQSRQIQQQYKQALDAAMQPRVLPGEAP